MTAEREFLKIPEMRQDVRTWIDWRPTMHHTSQSLVNILRDELTELHEAKVQARPDSEIKLEVGDVLFSTLALDTGAGEFTKHYQAISKYCSLEGTSMTKLYKEIKFKNDVNYPIYFFQV